MDAVNADGCRVDEDMGIKMLPTMPNLERISVFTRASRGRCSGAASTRGA